MKILLIDDDAFLRDMYATKFAERGDVVLTATDGQEALEKLKQESDIDVVVLDMVMPAMTGIEFLKAAQSIPGDYRCVVLSNQGEPRDIDAAEKAGAVGYIVKAESIPSEVVAKVHALATKA